MLGLVFLVVVVVAASTSWPSMLRYLLVMLVVFAYEWTVSQSRMSAFWEVCMALCMQMWLCHVFAYAHPSLFYVYFCRISFCPWLWIYFHPTFSYVCASNVLWISILVTLLSVAACVCCSVARESKSPTGGKWSRYKTLKNLLYFTLHGHFQFCSLELTLGWTNPNNRPLSIA